MNTSIFIVPVAVLLMCAGCRDGCKNSIASRTVSPDGSHAAVLFQRDCGATTGFSTQISVLQNGEDPGEGGNIFRADDDHGAARTGSWGGPWADMEWLAPDHLLVRYAAQSRIFAQEREMRDIKIEYQRVDH